MTFSKNNFASAGNRTRINCLEGSYADHYTTDAILYNYRKIRNLSYELKREKNDFSSSQFEWKIIMTSNFTCTRVVSPDEGKPLCFTQV